ncbi:MAG TPA: histidine kinase N-terminal 7TM domain-containing protein [Anaerolineales bacterium]|nr:histidine kinase N-terminal 7TM domain-containing protein [Anaerolineales bacterium]
MQNTPFLILWLISFASTFSMGVYTIRHRKHIASIPFALMCFFAALWAGSYIFELGGITLPTKLWALKIGYIGGVGRPLSWAAFALAYSGYAKWLTRRNILLALIFPVLTLFVIFTNEFHHWFFARTGLYIHPISGLITLYDPFGWWFWMHALYAYIFLLFGTYLLLHEYWSKKDIYRSQIFANVLAIFFPWISNGIILLGIFPLPFDITAIAFSISISILGWNFLRYGFLDLVPVAHRAIVESIADAVIVLDSDLRIVDLNPSALELFHLKDSSAIGQSFESVLQPTIRLDQQALRQHGYHKQIALETAGQPVKWLDLHISSLHDSAAQGGQIITLRDVTSLKENEAALAIARDEAIEANRSKTQLLANVSHELRTPLGVIMGYTDLIARKSYGEINEKQAAILSRIRESTEYLDGLVSELLDQAQLDSGKLKLAETPFAPREVFGKTSNQLSILAEAKSLDYQFSISDDLPISIVGDSQRLKQILVNLISNAIKFTEKGSVRAKIFKASAAKWKIEVADTGSGIPEEALRTIFEPFKQLPEASKVSRKGYGLGLSITRQLIHLMGGEINVESRLNVGTTFIVTLPLITEIEKLHA